MAILSKVYIIVCLLLNVLMCQRQDHLVYSMNKLHPEAMAMAKHPRSYVWEGYSPIRSSQMEVPICPAEDPNDVRFEEHPNVKLDWKNIVRDEDDGEDLDMAAGGDDDDDDDDEEGDDDEENRGTGMDGTTGDDPAFVSRIACLMSTLDQHVKAIVCNVNNIGSHLSSLKPNHEEKEPKHKTKCSKKPKYFMETPKDDQDDLNGASVQYLDTGFIHTPFHGPVHSDNMEDLYPQGSVIYTQDREEISPQGSAIYFPDGGEISPPGSGIHFQSEGEISPQESEIHFQDGGQISPPGSEIYSQNNVEILQPESGNHFQNGGEISPPESEETAPPGSVILFQNGEDISPPGPGTHLQIIREDSPPESEIQSQDSEDISPPGSGIYSQDSEEISPPGPGIHFQNMGDVPPPESVVHFQNNRENSPPGSGIHFQNRGNPNSPSVVGAPVSPRISDLTIMYPLPESYNHQPYEEYETKLRRLMANRDAIERNVIRMLAPRPGERM